MLGISLAVIGKEIQDAKLLRAAPAVLATNRTLVVEVLNQIKPVVEGQTPIGPGHFGYHGRDTLKIVVASRGTVTVGKLKAAVQLFWREYGTLGRHRGPKRISRRRRDVGIMTGRIGTGGEPAYMTAHKAAGVVKRFIAFYYGSMANWWAKL